MIETLILKNRFEAESEVPQTVVHETEILSMRAKVVLNFLEKWGMVAAMTDGQDSSGRAKLELLTPAATVDRAIEIADEAFSRLEQKGWITQGPTFAEMKNEVLPAKLDESVRETISEEY